MPLHRTLLSVVLVSMMWTALGTQPAAAQAVAPAPPPFAFKDTSMIKPPPGAKVAIIEFEDLECPPCARMHPLVVEAVQRYKLAFVRKDYPLPSHIWSTDAAIWARYMQDTFSPALAAEYRTAVFAAQTTLANQDDLVMFTQKFLQTHGKATPAVVDPAGQFRKEVFEDKALGEAIGIKGTPTVFVCNEHNWVWVKDPRELNQTIETLQAQADAGVVMKKDH